LTVAVGTALSVAILAPALVWISFLAPTAWSSAGFVVGFVSAGAVLFFLCFAIARLLADAVTAPIFAAAARIEHIADTGNDLPDAPLHTVGELDHLLSAVRHLVETARGRERRLATAIGALAHDVRTDLRAIATVLTLGRTGPGGDVVLPAATADLVDREIERARTMTSDLVVLMRSPETLPEPGPTPVDVAGLVEDVVASVAARSSVAVAIEIEKRFERPVPRALVERALRNVIDNAVRYARTSVTVRVYDGLVIVADDGPGMQREASDALASGLHGYGFQIASRLAELVGGRVAIERSDASGTVVLVYV
jgi:two-component system, OmpR family, sensor kinase